MARGGLRPGAGRPKGTANRHTVEREQAVREAAEMIGQVIPDAFEGDAHAYLMAVYKNPTLDVELRVAAARAAIRYEKPALSSVEASGKGGGPIAVDVRPNITDRDRARALAALIARVKAEAQPQ